MVGGLSSQCFPFVDFWFTRKYVVEETQNFESICKCEESTAAEKVGRRGFKKYDQNWADELSASEEGFPASSRRSCLRWTNLAFYISLTIGAFVVRSRNSNIPAQSVSRGSSFHVLYKCAITLFTASLLKLRRFKNRKEKTEAKISFLLLFSN